MFAIAKYFNKGLRATVLLLPLLSLLYGCGISRPIVEQYDSVRVEYRDRIITDSVMVYVPEISEKVVTKDSTSHLENEWAVSDADIKDGMLYHSLATKPDAKKVPVTIHTTDTLTVREYGRVIYKEKSLTPKQERLIRRGRMFNLAIIAIALLVVGCIVVKVKRYFSR